MDALIPVLIVCLVVIAAGLVNLARQNGKSGK